MIAEIQPDILLLTGFDYDAGHAALGAFATRLAELGIDFPHLFALRPNSGMATGLDLDGNGRTGEPRDAQGYGRFAGHGGMALLSRFAVIEDEVDNLSDLLWRNAPDARLPMVGGVPFPSPEAVEAQRLSSTGHWIVPLRWPGRNALTLLAFSATPPVFDGPEDRNGLRNADEIRLWQTLLDGRTDLPAPEAPFILLGNANLDPTDGDGLHKSIETLLADPRLQDPKPASNGGALAADASHGGDPALDTADWSAPEDGGPGNLRVQYVLPSADLRVADAGVHWPAEGAAAEVVRAASRHRLVWVDIEVNR